MYRILLQTKAASLNSPATYQYLMDKNTVWEVEGKDEALARYELELDNYKKSVMTLIKCIEVELNPSVESCDCPPACDCPTTPDTPAEPTTPGEGGETPATPTPEEGSEDPVTNPTE